MSTAIVIRACYNCHTELADPDYGGTLCGSCADEMLTCELERREHVIQEQQYWSMTVVGSVLCVLMAVLYCAGAYGVFVLARRVIHWIE